MLFHSDSNITYIAHPVDRTISLVSRNLGTLQMLSGSQVVASDVRRSLFRNLVTQLGIERLDSFQAVASALYTHGKLEPSEGHDELALEMQLNVIAFYQ
jgi:hypothetical protein